MILMLTMMTAMSMLFMILKHPISMGITIIVQTLIIGIITGLILKSFWFSYIIMIMMLSGMLVLFIYMASVASNEKINKSNKMIMLTTSIIILGSVMQMTTDVYEDELLTNHSMTKTESMYLNSLFNMKFKYITMMTVLYLFFTMITVSHITNILEGPLRIKK
uniref:NADH-ubiquinone oxidoreductase chain 6 n=1 Tax=Anthocoris kerzhneri TaxID=642067 RepID=A0A4D6QG38_9HEMI|nr:NADH dehydrogenase subunit 6 [Anthocoris kerzhneri]